MKKLSLKKLKLKSNDLLQRNQLKSVFGGDGGGYAETCSAVPVSVCYTRCLERYMDQWFHWKYKCTHCCIA